MLRTTDITMPAGLAELIALHREMFGDTRMMADDQPAQGQPADSQKDEPKPAENGGSDDFKSEHSKQSLLADLAKTREDNRAMRSELDQLKPLRAQMEALAKAFAPEQGNVKVEDAVAAVEARLAAAEHRALVAEHAEGLSKEDKEILSKITDADLMASVAKRLRDASAPSPTEPGRRTPKPDRSAGSGADAKSGGSVASGRDLYQSRHAKN